MDRVKVGCMFTSIQAKAHFKQRAAKKAGSREVRQAKKSRNGKEWSHKKSYRRENPKTNINAPGQSKNQIRE